MSERLTTGRMQPPAVYCDGPQKITIPRDSLLILIPEREGRRREGEIEKQREREKESAILFFSPPWHTNQKANCKTERCNTCEKKLSIR